jgi:hypothetical protein
MVIEVLVFFFVLLLVGSVLLIVVYALTDAFVCDKQFYTYIIIKFFDT